MVQHHSGHNRVCCGHTPHYALQHMPHHTVRRMLLTDASGLHVLMQIDTLAVMLQDTSSLQ